MQLEIQELRILTAIIEQGSFQNAAKSLHLTQSAVSQSLANLERKVGERLVERSRPTRATAVGHTLLGHAQIMLERQNAFFHDLERMKQGYLQSISIAADHLANSHYCAPVITALMQEWPEVNIRVRQMPGREIVHAVRERRFDLGLSFFQKNMDGLTKVKLSQEASLLVAGRNDPNLRLYRRDPMQYLRETRLLTSFIDPPDTRPSHKKIRDYFGAVWEVDNLQLQLQLLSQGVAAAYVPQTVLAGVKTPLGLKVLDKIPFSKIEKPYGVYFGAGESLDGVLGEFVGRLRLGAL